MLTAFILLVIYCIYRKWVEGPRYNKTNRIDGKVVIVTGCNTGIGEEIALEMARRGGRVYMACINFDECEKVRLEIVKRSQNPNVFNRQLDLASFKSVRAFVEQFSKDEQQLDILINNAGLMTQTPVKTKEGYEQHLTVNHLGHFLLTNLLMDKLKASPYARIVVVSSAVHKLGRIRKDDINNELTTFGVTGYFNSKLANVLFTRHLAKILKGSHVTVNCLHPGCVSTNIEGISGVPLIIVQFLKKLFMRSRRGGAQTSIFLALDPDMKGRSGGYYDRMTLQKYTEHALDDEMAKWLWHESEIMVGLKERQ